MFGLTFDKLLLVMLVAGIVIGPQRLPMYARQFAEIVRAMRSLVETTRAAAEAEMGVSLQRSDWTALDPRKYDPRRIVRDVLEDPTGTTQAPTIQASGEESLAAADRSQDAEFPADAALVLEASRVRPGQRYLVTGSAAHPRRILIDSLPADDPRRIAAYSQARDDEDHTEQPVSTPPAPPSTTARCL